MARSKAIQSDFNGLEIAASFRALTGQEARTRAEKAPRARVDAAAFGAPLRRAGARDRAALPTRAGRAGRESLLREQAIYILSA